MMKKIKNVSLADYSSIKIGGKADELWLIDDKKELLNLQKPYLVIGSGTNILFSDQGFRGTIIKIKNTEIDFQKDKVIAGAGLFVSDFVQQSAKKGYDFSNFSWPGTIGGSLVGNAGVSNLQFSDCILGATIFDIQKKELLRVNSDWFNFTYRFSKLKNDTNFIVWNVELNLKCSHRNNENIFEKIKDKALKRTERQPQGFSAGSFFKNPKGHFAGELLEGAYCKGMSVGDAKISTRHANFIINRGEATQKDVINLAKQAQQNVYDKFKIILEPEVRIIDEGGETIPLEPTRTPFA